MLTSKIVTHRVDHLRANRTKAEAMRLEALQEVHGAMGTFEAWRPEALREVHGAMGTKVCGAVETNVHGAMGQTSLFVTFFVS